MSRMAFDPPDYQVYMLLKNGSFGAVHTAMHISSRRKFYVKIICKAEYTADALTKFHDEVSLTWKGIIHENIARVHDHLNDHDKYYSYLLLEPCAGGNLNTFLASRVGARLPEIIALRFLAQLTCALKFLHGKGIVHGNLRPANVLFSDITDGAVLKLSYGGFARHFPHPPQRSLTPLRWSFNVSVLHMIRLPTPTTLILSVIFPP